MRQQRVQYPEGYWSRTFDRAVKLMEGSRKDVNPIPPEQAYWLARLEIDSEIAAANPQQVLEGVQSEIDHPDLGIFNPEPSGNS